VTAPGEKFAKIITLDDWGNVGYYLKAKKSSAGTWGHEEQDQSFRLKNGDKLVVKWPDGTLTNEVCKIVSVTNTVHDHGHEYTVKSERLYFAMKKFGAKVEFDDFSKIRVRRAR
jgi:hypothetical protein